MSIDCAQMLAAGSAVQSQAPL